jgi:hypothetical protein
MVSFNFLQVRLAPKVIAYNTTVLGVGVLLATQGCQPESAGLEPNWKNENLLLESELMSTPEECEASLVCWDIENTSAAYESYWASTTGESIILGDCSEPPAPIQEGFTVVETGAYELTNVQHYRDDIKIVSGMAAPNPMHTFTQLGIGEVAGPIPIGSLIAGTTVVLGHIHFELDGTTHGRHYSDETDHYEITAISSSSWSVRVFYEITPGVFVLTTTYNIVKNEACSTAIDGVWLTLD